MVHSLRHTIVYACAAQRQRSNEHRVQEHALGYSISGENHFHTNQGVEIYAAGAIGLIRKNQLVRTIKVPAADGTSFKAIHIFLDQPALKEFNVAHSFMPQRATPEKR